MNEPGDVSQAAKDAAEVLATEPGRRLLEHLAGLYLASPVPDGATDLAYARQAGRADIIHHIATLAATGRAGQQAPARPVLTRMFRTIFQIEDTHHD